MTLSYSSSPRGEGALEEGQLREALAVELRGEEVQADVHEGWDVFGVPHGGYLTALAANALLAASGAPDLFTITVHFLRKAKVGPMRFSVRPVGGSRRFTSYAATAHQGERLVLSVMASLGDAATLEGPRWTDRPPPPARPKVVDEPSFTPPSIARKMGLALDAETVAFAAGETTEAAEILGVADVPEPDVLAALIACDLTPPAIWNVRGVTGWVPTLELTAHIRGRPTTGPLHIQATTRELAGGLLEEDALVHDAEGRLVVQSRQLALWSGT